MKSIATLPNVYQRIIVGSASIILLTALLRYSHTPPFDWLFFLLLATVAGSALHEFYALAQRIGSSPLTLLGLATNTLYILLWFLGYSPLGILIVAFACSIFFYLKSQQQAINNLSVTFFGLLYITVPLTLLLDIQFGTALKTSFWTIFIIATTKCADIFAYLAGKLFGTTKLCPQLSPKKTIAGAIGAILGSALTAALLLAPVTIEGALFGCIIGLFAIAGDLFESIFKRDAAVKDSGRIPGLGGALDMVDSLLFTIPVLYIYLVSNVLI